MESQTKQENLSKFFEKHVTIPPDIKGIVQKPTQTQDNFMLNGVGWKLNDMLSKLICEISDLKQIASQYSLQLYDLNSQSYFLNQPLFVIVQFENEFYYAEAVDFDIYGEGETIKDAINNLKDSIVIYFESLQKEEKNLSNRLKSKYRLLKKLIIHEK